MFISDEHLDDFIKRWENASGETLSREEARVRALELIELYKAVSTRPTNRDNAIAPPTTVSP